MSKSDKFLLTISVVLSTSIGSTVLAGQEGEPSPIPAPSPCWLAGQCGSPFLPEGEGEGEVPVNLETSMQATTLTTSTVEVVTAPAVINV